jgi:hypothetical protein
MIAKRDCRQADTENVHPSSQPDKSCAGPAYGYWQIDNFAKKDMKKVNGIRPGPKLWVPLPCGTNVVASHAEGYSKKSLAHPLRSSLSSPRSSSDGDATPRSSSDGERRRIRFADGLVPSCDANDQVPSNAALAEWIFIDRDTCGFSLYEYAPDDAEFADFASSDYGRMFKQELSEVVQLAKREQRAAMSNEAYLMKYHEEEKVLHQLLELAGVDQTLLKHEVQMSTC